MAETKRLTKKQYEALEPWEKDIMAAYKNSFLHVTGSDFLKLADIYKDITGTELTRSQKNCNSCRLNTLRKLGEMYSNYKEETARKETRRKKLEGKGDAQA